MKKLEKKQILFGAIIVVVIGLSVTAAVLFSQYQATIRPASTPKKDTPSQKLAVEEKADDAMKQAYDGDVSGGAATLDEAIENTSDNHEKYVYYSRKATLLYNNQDLPGALTAALKAYELEKSSDSAALVGQFSREAGNKTQAIEYYKKAIELVNKGDPYSNEDTEYYKSIVKELGGN